MRNKEPDVTPPPDEEPIEYEYEDTREVLSGKQFFLKALAWVGSALAIIVLTLLLWMNLPVIKQLVVPSPTQTPVPPTATVRPTRTPTKTAEPTLPAPPTATPLPTSVFEVPDLQEIVPPIPGYTGPGIILDNEKSTQVDPPFTSPEWTSSSQIAQQLNAVIEEPYYATFAAGSVMWTTDKELAPGYYDILILDTLTSSGGSLDFSVSRGGEPLYPIAGLPHVQYLSSYTTPPQTTDIWHSIGIYGLDRQEKLSIFTSWTKRDEYTIVAIDRVAIIHLPDSAGVLLSKLPLDRMKFVVDDAAARFATKSDLVPMNDRLSWGDQFQAIVNPNEDVQVTWSLVDPVPSAQYEVLAWIPEIHGDAEVEYRLFAADIERNPIDGDSPVTVRQRSVAGGQWLSIGKWEMPELIFGPQVYLTVQMDVKGGTTGEVAADAIAFVRQP